MESNPTTGFDWFIPQVLKGENSIFEIAESQFVGPANDDPKTEGMVGRGGHQSK